MSWKRDKPLLPDNYSIAFDRLQCTEKKLKRSPELVKPTRQKDTFIECLVRKLSLIKSGTFPISLCKSTTKTSIVFDASAKFNELSLNDIVL